MAHILLNLPDTATNRRERPDSRDAISSGAAYEKLGSSREPVQIRSPEAEARRHGYVVNLTSVERANMNTAKVGIRDGFAVI